MASGFWDTAVITSPVEVSSWRYWQLSKMLQFSEGKLGQFMCPFRSLLPLQPQS